MGVPRVIQWSSALGIVSNGYQLLARSWQTYMHAKLHLISSLRGCINLTASFLSAVLCVFDCHAVAGCRGQPDSIYKTLDVISAATLTAIQAVHLPMQAAGWARWPTRPFVWFFLGCVPYFIQ